MIIAGQLLLVDHPPRARLCPGYVRVADGVMSEVVAGELPSTYDLGGPNSLVSPGFIDTHLHLPQFDMMGGHGLPLLDWLETLTFPAERKWRDPDYAASMARRVLNRCLSCGTTTIAAYSSVHHDATMAALQIAADLGIRGVIGQSLMDREVPSDLRVPTSQMIDEAATTLDRFSPRHRMAAAITPRFAVSCTPKLMQAVAQLSREHEAIVQTHLAETERECELVESMFDGVRYVDVYDQVGLVHGRTILGHGIYLNGADRQLLADRKATIAHCPTANSFLRSGIMNRALWIQDRVSLSLGSDIGAGYEVSMVRVGRSMIEAASAIGDDYPTAEEAFYTITAGNAAAMGFADAGCLRVGDPADLVIIAPSTPWLESNHSPLSTLMFSWDDRWIHQTLLRGEIAYRTN